MELPEGRPAEERKPGAIDEGIRKAAQENDPRRERTSGGASEKPIEGQGELARFAVDEEGHRLAGAATGPPENPFITVPVGKIPSEESLDAALQIGSRNRRKPPQIV